MYPALPALAGVFQRLTLLTILKKKSRMTRVARKQDCVPEEPLQQQQQEAVSIFYIRTTLVTTIIIVIHKRKMFTCERRWIRRDGESENKRDT